MNLFKFRFAANVFVWVMSSLLILSSCSLSQASAEHTEDNRESTITMVVSADGATKTEAINNALRSAIEQTFGTFVSANTEVLNDQLVRDEIATVSSGNIQKYKEIALVALPNGNISVTLSVSVSLKKLIEYAQSKGAECDFAGAVFAANKRMYDFNKKNEQIAMQNLLKQLDALRPIYDYEIKISEPYMVDSDDVSISYTIRALANEKTEQFNELLENTLKTLGKSEKEVKPLKESGFFFEPYYISTNGKIKKKNLRFFYNKIPDELELLLSEVPFDLAITDNEGNDYSYFVTLENSIVQHVTANNKNTSYDIKTSSGKYMLALLIPATLYLAATWIWPDKVWFSSKTEDNKIARFFYSILVGGADIYYLVENLKGSNKSKVTINRSGIISVDGNNYIVINPKKNIWESSSGIFLPIDMVEKINKIYVKPQKK